MSRLWPAALVLAALALAYALGWPRYLSLQALAREQVAWREVVAAHPLAAAGAFVLLYILVVAVSLPGSAMLTVAGGLLFGPLAGTACAVAGASIGAVLLYLAARHAAGAGPSGRAGLLVGKLRDRLEQDGFSYLLAIRLLPVVPFWLANLAPALAGMRLLPFAAATVLGIIPATFVFASIGAGLGTVLQRGGTADLAVALHPAVLLPLGGLAAVALLPVAYRRWRARCRAAAREGSGERR